MIYRRIIYIIAMLMIVSGLYYLSNNYIYPHNNIEPLNITLLPTNNSSILTPYEYYKLSNGSIIRVADKNPFPFKIEIVKGLDVPGRDKLNIYRVYYYNISEINPIVNDLIKDAKCNYLMMLPGVIVCKNETVSFEYREGTGFFRIVYDNVSVSDYKSFIEENLLRLYPENISFTNHYNAVKEIDGKPVNNAIIYRGSIDDIPTELKIIVVLDENASIKEIQGILVKRVEKVSRNKVIPVGELPRLLTERVSGERLSKDWYMSRIGFTFLHINNVELEYVRVQDNLLVPVYKFHGDWKLEYDILDYEGVLEGVIVAVSG